MRESVKVTYATVTLDSIVIDGFMLLNGSYWMSQTQMAKTVAKSGIDAQRFLDSKGIKVLIVEDYMPNSVDVESGSQVRDKTRIRVVPLEVVIDYWLIQAQEGNKQAFRLIQAMISKTLEHLSSQSFDTTRSENELNRGLSASIIAQLENDLSISLEGTDSIVSREKLLEQQPRELRVESWTLPINEEKERDIKSGRYSHGNRSDAVQQNLSNDQSTLIHLKNRDALKLLEQERSLLQAGYGIGGTATTGGVIFTNPLVADGGIVSPSVILKRVEKVSRIIRVGADILNNFETQGLEMYLRLEVPGHNPLDLFLRFPLAMLLISIRSMGNAEIVFKESNETLYVKRKGKGSKKWLPDPLLELSEYQSWLKNNRQEFKMSSKDVRKPLAKVLVMTGGSKIDKHQEQLYSSLYGENLLTLSRKGTAIVILEEQVIDFIRAHLAKYEAQEA